MPHRLADLHPHTLPTLLGLAVLALALIALAPSAL
jgi:hypothetical protein